MNRAQLEHLIRAAGTIADIEDFAADHGSALLIQLAKTYEVVTCSGWRRCFAFAGCPPHRGGASSRAALISACDV